MNDASMAALAPAGRVRLNAEVLKARRHQLGLSQEAFALACFERQLCVSIASVKRAETGKSLLLRTARHLAAFHGVPLQALLLPEAAVRSDGRHDTPAPLDEPSSPAAELVSMEGRLVQVLCTWPVSERDRPALSARLQAAGAQIMADAQVDTLVAVFGLPRAQRDDVPRCLQAAQQCVAQHVFISSGRWSDNELDWPREGVSGWARRQAAGIYVHRSMHGQVRLLHHLDKTAHPDIGRLGRALDAGARLFHMVGRQQELRLFDSLLQGVLTDQQSHVLLLQGMAGMGKSRLVAEMVDIAQRHFLFSVVVELHDFGGDRHRAVMASLLHALLGLTDDTPFRDQLIGQRLAHLALPAELQWLCRDLLSARLSDDERKVMQAMDHATRLQRMVQLLSHILARMALQRPLLLVVEDLHWASSSTLETLARVMTSCQESQILWVLSSRVESPQRMSELQRLLPDLAVTSLTLAPLRPSEVNALMRQFPQVDERWQAQCASRAQGHPLFLTQLLMADRHDALPDNFQHLLQVRLDEVSPQDRHALRLAAVLGQPFDAAALQALMQSPGYAVEVLVQHCLLRQLDGGHYDFLHALIRQGIYEALPVRQREALHVQVAESVRDHDPVLYAQHLHLARRAQAPDALLDAAQQRQDVFDHEAALSLLMMYGAIDYATRDDHRHAMALGAVHVKMGAMTAARQAFEAAVKHAGDGVARLSAQVALAGVLNVLEALQAEEALIDEALVEAERLDARAQAATLHYLKGNLYFPRGDVASSRHHHQQARAWAESVGEERVQAQALSGLGDSYYAEGLMHTAHAHFVQCLALCEAHGLRDIEASNRFMLATTQIYLCDTTQALQQAVRSADLARRVGNRRAEVVSRLTAGWIELGAGRVQEALTQVSEGLLVSRAMGAMRFEPFLQETQARALWSQGETQEARRVIDAALDGVERLNLHAFIGPWVMGTWALLQDDESAAQAMLQRAESQIERGCVAHNIYRFYASAMEWSVLHAQGERARQLGAAWLQRTGREPVPWVRQLHDFMTACLDPDGRPTPQDARWQDLRRAQILHVMLRLPRVLLS